MTPAQLAKQAAAILERAEFGNAEPGEIERARRWLIEAAGMGWQDIASAPRDGTPLILFARAEHASASVVAVGYYLNDRGWVESTFTPNVPTRLVPSHWMPRPEFPDGGQ